MAIPNLTRQSLETLTAGVVLASLSKRRVSDATAQQGDAMDRLSQAAMQAYRTLVYETPGFVDYFYRRDPDHRDCRPQYRQPADIAAGDAQHRRAARDPLGVLVGAVARDAAGLVRFRVGGEGCRRRDGAC